MSQWPFAARQPTLQDVLRRIGGRTTAGVVLAGPAGVGKSRLAREAAAQLPAGRFHVERVRATQSGSGIPFGATAHLLPLDGEPPRSDPVGWAAAHIVERAGRLPLVLTVDDAHLLDPTSASLVHLLAKAHRARILATVRTGEAAPDPVSALWDEGLASRVELAPFDRAEAAEVVAAALGGPVADDTVTRLWRRSQGNALLLNEVVLSAIEAGALTVREGVWWLADGPALSPRLADVIDERVGRLVEAELDVLEYVAFGEPVGVDLLAGMVPADMVEAVAARGLIRITVDGRRRVAHLAHPLFGELARSRCPETRRRRKLADLAAATLATGARRRGDTLRVAVWGLDSGTATDPASLHTGCRLAWAAQDYTLAVRLGRAAVAAGAGVEASLLLANVLMAGDEHDEADRVLAAVIDGDHDERMRTRIVLARVETLGWGLRRRDDALALVSQAEASTVEHHNRLEIKLARMAVIGSLQSDYSAALAIGESILDAGPAPLTEAGARAQMGWFLFYLGRPLDAIACAESVLGARDVWRDESPQWAGDMSALLMQASQMVGPIETFEAAVTRAAEEVGGSLVYANTVMVNRGIAALLRGRVATAIRLLREAETVRPIASRAMSGMTELARALAYHGEVDAAAEALGVGEQRLFVHRRQKVPFGVRLTAPWVAAAAGDVTAAVEQCLEAAEFFRGEGVVRRELAALHDAVRLGGAEAVADRLGVIASTFQGGLAAIYAAHARAVVAGDGPALDRVTEGFARMGRVLHAAEAAAHASEAYAAADRVASARVAAQRSRALSAGCEGAVTPALIRLNARDLTARELEIGQLAAGGMTSTAIAGRLLVSPRTVENHLHVVYAKLGITGRAELRDALTGLSSSARSR